MATSRINLFIYIVAGLLPACVSEQEQKYIREVEEWRHSRIDFLKGKTGYVNLAGLYWLKEGPSTFGSDDTNDIRFPEQAPATLGTFIKMGDSVMMMASPEAAIRVQGTTVQDTLLLFDGDAIQRQASYGSFNWFIIKRGDEIGVRLRDYEHPLINELEEIDAYPIDPEWRVEARWEPYDPPKSLSVPNQLGMIIELQAYGAFHFELMGGQYTLEPVGKPDQGEYLLMIYDETSGHETYGSGRYIYVPEPNEQGITYIDFNKAYNPPCVYTEFATCLFPHEANRLPFKLEAGEKFAGH